MVDLFFCDAKTGFPIQDLPIIKNAHNVPLIGDVVTVYENTSEYARDKQWDLLVVSRIHEIFTGEQYGPEKHQHNVQLNVEVSKYTGP